MSSLIDHLILLLFISFLFIGILFFLLKEPIILILWKVKSCLIFLKHFFYLK